MSLSDEHKSFLRNVKKEKLFIVIFRFLILFMFIIGWEFLAHYEIINTFSFSSPSRVFNTICELVSNGTLFEHIFVTIDEVLISFLLATIIGIITASILWRFPIISKIIDPYLTILNSLPKVALGPLIIIWVGAGRESIIFMSLLISTFITIINIYSAFINTSNNYILLLKSFSASKWQIFKYGIFPANYSAIINVLKINISMNLIGVIMGELLVSKDGIGYLIMYGSQIFNIDLVISGVFILGIISYLMYFVINKIEYFFKKN